MFCSQSHVLWPGLPLPREDSRNETSPGQAGAPGLLRSQNGVILSTCKNVLRGLEVILSVWLEFSIGLREDWWELRSPCGGVSVTVWGFDVEECHNQCWARKLLMGSGSGPTAERSQIAMAMALCLIM